MPDSRGHIVQTMPKAAVTTAARAMPAHKRGTLAYYLNRILGELHIGSCHRYIFVELSDKQLPKMPRGYQVRQMDKDDPVLGSFTLYPEVLDWRYGQGGKCFVVYRGQAAACIAWIVQHRFDEDEVRATYLLPEKCSWDLGMEVLSDYRGSRAVFAVLAALHEAMKACGVQRTISQIADSNIGSLSTHEKLGCKKLGSAVFVNLFGIQFCFSRLRPLPHVSFSKQSRATFNFS
jgi:hypothetical protein